MSILPYIEVFTAVVEMESFTAAAEMLGISKPVVSKKISKLEAYLGTQLIRRTTRRLNLTEAGQIFSHYAKNIVADAQKAEQSIQPLQSKPKGKLSITAPESLAMTLLPNALSGFQQLYPEIELDLSISGKFVDLIEDDIDIALRMGELSDSSLIARKLLTSSIHVCASPAYWKKHGKPKHPNDLKNYNCLLYTQSPRFDMWSFKGDKGKEFNVKVKGNLKSDMGNMVLEAGLRGQGVFIAPTFMVSKFIQEGTLEQIFEQYLPRTSGLYAIYPYSKMVSLKVRVFVDYFIDVLRK